MSNNNDIDKSSSTIRMRMVAYLIIFMTYYDWILIYSIGILIIISYTGIMGIINYYIVIYIIISLIILLWWYMNSPHIYCIDHSQFNAPNNWLVSHDDIINIAKIQDCYTQESIDFMKRLLERSGTCPDKSAAYPPAVVDCLNTNKPVDATSYNTRYEAKEVIINTVNKLFNKTNINPKSIDYVIVNCAMYNPIPSHAAMIVNHFNMRDDIITYNLRGMGCSAGVISIDLARRLLNDTPNKRALIVSTEILTRCFYRGNDREPLMGNTLFRCGAAATILSSKYNDRYISKYKLLNCIRTQVIGNESFESIIETDDSSNNIITLRLQKSIIKVAGIAIKQNFKKLGKLILPYREIIKVLLSIIKVKYGTLFNNNKSSSLLYIPDFRKCIDHWCIHAGGRGVLDSLQYNIKLSDYDILPSRNVLYNNGNTSSSSIWYELDYIENNNRIKLGDRILQLAFGSGFKCNSAIWLAINNNKEKKEKKKGKDNGL